MKIEGERVFLTKDEALPLINAETYHTFDNSTGLLVGCDGSLDYINDLLNNADFIELAGETARKMSHGMVVFTKNKRLLFVETVEEKLKEFEKTIKQDDEVKDEQS